MGSISLPALHLNPPAQQPNVLEQYGQLLQLKNEMQNAPLRQQILQQQAQTGQMQLQQDQQSMKDQQSFRAAMSDPSMQGKTIGDVADALAKTGGISQTGWIAAKKADVEQRKAIADLNDKQFDVAVKATAANKQLLENVMSLPDEQIAANWPQIAQQYDAIPGNEKRPLDPRQPLTREQLQQQGPLLAVHQAYIDADTARRKAQDEGRKTAAEATQAEQNLAFGPSGPAADAKYRGLQQKMAAGQPVTPDDQNWIKGYEKQKLLVPTTRIALQQGNGMSSTGPNDIKDAADMIRSGQAPPVLTEYSFRDRTKLAAELHRQGYNLAGAEQDWKATQKFLQTANGAQQMRLRQAITALPDLSDKIEGLYNEWSQIAPTSGFKVLNKASLAAMKNLPGRPGAVAQALDAQIADAVSDLAVVYMGGNSPTDHGLSLAQKNLSSDWNADTFKEGLKQLKLNAQIRKNSLNVGPVGVSSGSPYPSQVGGGDSAQPAQTGTVTRYKIVNGQLVPE